jgi:hypothetical protein
MIEAKKILRRGAGDNAACFEQDDAGSKQQGFAQIMGDENDGLAEAPGEAAELPLKLGAGDGIERTEGLIHQQDWWIRGESAGYADTLALPAGKFAWAAVGKFRGIQSDKTKELSDSNSSAAAVPFFQGGNEGNILRNGEMGEETGVLYDVTDASTKTDGVPIGGGAALDQDSPLGGHQHPVDQFEEGGLAAAAAPEEDQGLPLWNSEGNGRHNHSRRNIVYLIRHIAKFD